MSRFQPDRDHKEQLRRILNSGLNFKDNFEGALLEIVTTGAEQEVHHGLGFIPIGFLVLLNTGPSPVWATRVDEWTKEILFCESSAASQEVRLFVL